MLKVAWCTLHVAWCMLHVACSICALQVECYMLYSACRALRARRTAACILHVGLVAFCGQLHAAYCMLHLFLCTRSSASCAASAARCIVRMEFVCLHRAALRCARVQGFGGGVLRMLDGDAIFEAVAISITSAMEVTELTRKAASCGMRARSVSSGRCLTGSGH
jgi:hypothetical protein